ncbi:MAG: peptidylprolyl isomerase [Anaerolineae bacterium]|nr:MAG: peptidylprolyl isomerase [Anaerolineae bacterium]
MVTEKTTPNKVADDVVVSMDYTLRVDGEVLDTSDGGDPIEFLQGRGNIIPGLESQLYDMAVDDTKDVIVSPKDGYGEVDPAAVIDVPREEFPPTITLEPGVTLQVQDNEGNVMLAQIKEVGPESVKLDFNHPLAGKELHFSVKIVGLREATSEELAHGHVHGAGHHH